LWVERFFRAAAGGREPELGNGDLHELPPDYFFCRGGVKQSANIYRANAHDKSERAGCMV
jgi:hypothetical protein